MPTIKVGDVYITNTWEIAEWVNYLTFQNIGRRLAISTNSKQLDGKYGLNKTPFPSEGEKTHAKFFELWSNKTVAAEIMPFVASTVGFTSVNHL